MMTAVNAAFPRQVSLSSRHLTAGTVLASGTRTRNTVSAESRINRPETADTPGHGAFHGPVPGCGFLCQLPVRQKRASITAVWARLAVPWGLKAPSAVPCSTPDATAQAIASRA